MKPELTDSRRLTGANLFWDLPAAIIDARVDGDPEHFIAIWSQAASMLLSAVGRAQEQITHRIFDGGFSLLVSAPVDVLYSMCELNEAAFEIAMAGLGFAEPPNFAASVSQLNEMFEKESNPPPSGPAKSRSHTSSAFPLG